MNTTTTTTHKHKYKYKELSSYYKSSVKSIFSQIQRGFINLDVQNAVNVDSLGNRVINVNDNFDGIDEALTKPSLWSKIKKFLF